MTKKQGPRLVNPDDRPVKDKIPYKTIIITTIVAGAAGFVLTKALEHAWEKGKKANPFGARPMGQNPIAGAVGPQQPGFQSPYSQMAQTQGLPYAPPEAPAPPTSEEAPPRWAAAFLEAHENRITNLEQRMGPTPVAAVKDDTAA